MKICITGGAGFVGSNAANAFHAKGHDVVAIDNLSLGWKENLNDGVTFIEGDIADPSVLPRTGSPDIIIHLAGSSSSPMFAKDLKGAVANNVLGHIEVLEFARKSGVKKVLFASTSSMYGNNPIPLSEDQAITPPNQYAVTKRTQEDISRVYSATFGLEIIAFRFMSVYGLHEEHKGAFANLVSQFIWGIEQNKSPVIYGDGMQTRDFTSVKDLLQAFELAIATEKKFGFAIFNVGTSEAINMVALVALINKIMGTAVAPTFIPNPIASGYIQTQQADLKAIQQALGYMPLVSLADGIREIVENRKTNPIPPRDLSY